MRTTTAAALFAEGGEWEIVELEVDPPRAGEVHVRFDYAGLCHSDEHLRFGAAGRLPIVGGHEGAGVVEEVGAGVRRPRAWRPRRRVHRAHVRMVPVVRDRRAVPLRRRRARAHRHGP